MSVIKQFYKPDPIEIQAQSINGEIITLKTNNLGKEKIKKVNELLKATGTDEDSFSAISDQLAIIFECDSTIFDCLDFQTLTLIRNYILDLMKNPTQGKGK